MGKPDEQIGGMRIITLNDGKRALVAEITGGSRLLLGYVGEQMQLEQGAVSRVAFKVTPA